jgi:hypothetical protein
VWVNGVTCVTAVEHISNQRPPQVAELGSDLVGATSFKVEVDNGHTVGMVDKAHINQN